ncbi:hypothetical protein [Dysgonomonas sp. 520]|uniref:hypothetical protein n=1 Tax=Dysgonomonas sp. 520 TaxID=2302931 RepID=UPI0013D4D8FB|nr:hypothetical protein [Dysgonomonas sp. 520]NDW09007.1 hypothetical protein [Dysgonomonas sp. 520]
MIDKISNNISLVLLLLLGIGIAFVLFEPPLLTLLGLFVFIYNCKRFFLKQKKNLPVLEFILVVSGIQWIVGPMIMYRLVPEELGVDENRYMLITAIAYLCFSLGMLVNSRDIVLDKDQVRSICADFKVQFILKLFSIIGIILLLGSTFTTMFQDIISTLFILLGLYSSIVLLYTDLKSRYLYIALILFFYLVKCIHLTVFADLISVLFILYIFLPNIYSWGTKKVLLMTLLGIMFLFVIDTTKRLYRQEVWATEAREVNIDLFLSIVTSSSIGQDEQASTISRFSSGSVNSLIFKYVPKEKAHTKGEVLLDDFANAIVPRVLYPEKKEIDTRKNYMLYTGIYINEDTSVGINALGIAYAEFGVLGSYIFMLILGFFLRKSLSFFINLGKKNIFYIFSIVMIYSTFFKAEYEFVSSVNSFIKSTIFILIIIFILTYNNRQLYAYSTENELD